MRNLTCAEISTEQKAPLVSHYGLLGTLEAQKVGGKNEPSKNGISPERTTGDQNQAPNRIQDEQTNNMQCSKTNFGQILGTHTSKDFGRSLMKIPCHETLHGVHQHYGGGRKNRGKKSVLWESSKCRLESRDK